VTKSSSAYWDGIADQVARHDPSETWRAYMRGVYSDLLRRWFADSPEGCTLKTDLFEEAVTPHHLFGELGPHGLGVDVSLGVVQAAARRISGTGSGSTPRLLVADLRKLPFATGCVSRILSGSSLDHFQRKTDIAVALSELARCLSPGGCLIVTFDNPHNPIVNVRNWLPFGLMRTLRLVPYFVGATYSRDDVEREFAKLGLRVTHLSAVAHVPRAPAIWIGKVRERLGRRGVSKTLLRLFRVFDRLESSVVRFQTGYYLAVRAVKPT
jgi:SAM-dependent methyltransferase